MTIYQDGLSRMAKRVALLADGRNSDLYAGLCAVKLAKRMDATLFSLLIVPDRLGIKDDTSGEEGWSDFSPSSFLQLVSGLCGLEKVSSSYHLIETVSDENLVEFLVSQKISCLIAGTINDEDFDRKREWSARIVNKVCSHPNWYFGELTVFLARPWSDECFKKVLRQINADCTLYPIEIASA